MSQELRKALLKARVIIFGNLVVTKGTVQADRVTSTGKRKITMGLPWWPRGYESALQCRGHWFNPWLGN